MSAVLSVEEPAVLSPAERAQQTIARSGAYWATLKAKYSADEIAAITHVYCFAKKHVCSSSGIAMARLLLGLYNGMRFQFDLTDLRLLDPGNLRAAMALLHMDAHSTRCEVHTLLDAIFADGYSTGVEFELWAYHRRIKGRSVKDALPHPGRVRP